MNDKDKLTGIYRVVPVTIIVVIGLLFNLLGDNKYTLHFTIGLLVCIILLIIITKK
jgi:hypothetical protein